MIDRLPLNDDTTFIPDVKVLELTKEQETAELKARLDDIEREMGKLTMEREAKGRRFQYLLSTNREVATNLEVRAPIDTTVHVNEPDPFQKEMKERFERHYAH
jgi:hypothetical protein